MQYIRKNKDNEPVEFQDWKTQNLSLDWQNQAAKYWKELQSETAVFKKLQEALLKEQGYLCCYCCVSISNQNTELVRDQVKRISIEHHQEKTNFPANTFDFENLLASCNSQGSCNLKRNNQVLILNPCHEEITKQVFLERNGKNIKLKSLDNTFENEINEVLNLNHSGLLAARRQMVAQVLQEINDLTDQGKNGVEIKSELLAKYENVENGKYQTFAFVAIWVISRHFSPAF